MQMTTMPPTIKQNHLSIDYVINEISMNTPCGTPLPPPSNYEGHVNLQMAGFPDTFGSQKENTPPNGIEETEDTNSNDITPGNIADEYALGEDEFVVEDDVMSPGKITRGAIFFPGAPAHVFEEGNGM